MKLNDDPNAEHSNEPWPFLANNEKYVRLMQVTNSLFNATNFEEVSSSVTCGLHALGLDRVRLYVPSRSTDDLTLKAQCGMSDEILGSTWKPGPEFVGRYFDETTQLHFLSAPEAEDICMTEPLVTGCIAECLIAPLRVGQTMLAVVVADNAKTGRPINESEISAISLFASQAAKAFHVAKLLRETKRQVEQLESVRLTTIAITEQHDHDQILRTIVEQAVQLLMAKNGGIYKYFPDTRELVVTTDYRRPHHVGVTLQLNEGIAGRLVADSLVGSAERFKSVPNYTECEERATVFDDTHPYGAVLEVLLKWNGQIVGVLYIDDDAGREFTEDEERLLGLCADQVAIALANVDLLELDQEKMDGLEKLSLATGEIMTNFVAKPFEERLTEIARHVTEILNAEVCRIGLVKEEGWLSLEASYGHNEKSFQPGLKLKVQSGPKLGLLGHIAFEGKVFNECGEKLRQHFAARNEGSLPHLPSGQCRSLLVVPFCEKTTGRLLGLLCANNKRSRNRVGSLDVKFTDTDVRMLHVFSEAVVIALETAGLVGELKQQKEQYRSLVSNSPAGMIAVDMAGRVTLFNERAADILGYTEEEALGRPVEELYADPEEPHRIAHLLHDNGGRLIDYETKIRHQSGDVIPIKHSSNWLYDSEGKRCGSVGYFEDMRRMQLLLKSSSIVAQPLNPREGLQRLAELTASYLPHTFCRILLIDEDERTMTVVAAHRLKTGAGPLITEDVHSITIDDWPGLRDWISNGQSIVLEHKDGSGRKVLGKLTDGLGLEHPIESLLVLPLRVSGAPAGLIEFGSSQPQRAFSQMELDLATALADKVTVLVDRMRLQELTEHRGQLLEALYEASLRIRADDKDIDRLLHEIVRIAVKMGGCEAGGLYVADPLTNNFALKALHGLPENLKNSRLPTTGVLAQVASTGQPLRYKSLGGGEPVETNDDPSELNPLAAVPLKNESGEVEAVLFVGTQSGKRGLGSTDLEGLTRFAAQASVALQISYLLTQEQRTFGKLSTLNSISDYFQATRDIDKMLHALLTGVTANYGLQFNRAALLLRERPGTFVGRMAIGHLSREDWKQMVESGDYIKEFPQYLQKLDREAIAPTPLGRIIRDVSFDLASCPDSVFSKAVKKRKPISVAADEVVTIPEEFAQVFEPRAPLVVVPVEFRNQVIGLVVADNKFTHAPVSAADVKLLVAFANTAAIAYDKARHIGELQLLNRAAHAMAQPFSRVSEGFSPVGDVLQTIVDQLRRVLSCDSATIWSYDPGEQKFIPEELRASGISKEKLNVFRSLEPWRQGATYKVLEDRWLAVADIDDFSYDFIRPEMREHLRDSNVRAFQGIALLVGDEPVGVLYSSYSHPQPFSNEDRRALENFATYAALSLKNAKLLDQLISVKKAAQVIAEVSALGDYDNTLDSIAAGTLKAVGCSAVVLYAYDPVTDKWKYPPTHAGVRFPKRAWPNDVVPEDSIVNQILKLDGLYKAERISEDELLRDRRFAIEEEIESCVAVPLLASGTRLGVMFVNFRTPTRFSSHQLENIMLFGNQAAAAIRNAQLFDRRARLLKKQHDLLEMSEELLLLNDEQKILDRAVEIAGKALGTEFCNIVLPDSDGRLFFKAGYGWERSLINTFELAKGTGSQTGYTIAERRPVSAYDYDDRSARKFDVPQLVFDRGLKSGLSVPMFNDREVVGSMLIHTRRLRKFDDEDTDLLRLIANQTAIALRGFQSVRRQNAYLNALYEASKELSAGYSDTPKQVLQRILYFAIHGLTSPDGKKPFLGTIQLYDEESGELVLESVYPPDAHPALVQRIKERRSLDPKISSGLIGVTGLAVLRGESYLIDDVEQQPEYVVYDANTKSELAVPLRSGNKVIGVINVESDRLGAFDKDDCKALEAFSDMAVIAIENARGYALLTQTKGLVGARTALAWMGMMSSHWRHNIDRWALTILNQVRNTRDHSAFKAGVPEWLEMKLRIFEEHAAKIKAAPTVPTLSADDTELINLSDFVGERLKVLWNDEHIYKAAKLQAVPDLNVSASVLVSSDWLSKLLYILIDNSFDAVKTLPADRRWIGVETRLADGGIELIISDGGGGIPDEIFEQLLKKPVEQTRADSQSKKGMGMGLLMADAIVEAYAGRLRVGKTGQEGTSMVIWLPTTN